MDVCIIVPANEAEDQVFASSRYDLNQRDTSPALLLRDNPYLPSLLYCQAVNGFPML